MDYRDGRLRRLRECRLLRRRGIPPSAAAWNYRTNPLRKGKTPGGATGPEDAQVDLASGARAGLEMRVHEAKTRPRRGADGITSRCNRPPSAAAERPLRWTARRETPRNRWLTWPGALGARRSRHAGR